MSEYNAEQRNSLEAIAAGLARMCKEEVEALHRDIQPYLDFRARVDAFQEEYFSRLCAESCFVSGRSACCSFESIITFFADLVIAWLLADEKAKAGILKALESPFRSDRCVYLGPKGCILPLRPVSCALFFCSDAKEEIFFRWPKAKALLETLREEEKKFTWPDRPVLFDHIEAQFLRLGVDSRHMYFHKSPGLLLVKKEAGLWKPN
ncbi:hypothetical protein SAMN02746041_00619 [Desulfacinum hydrothermale DSM 13146]|uniref:Uncharacterized protein n=1 Tax=Desulfacinum hydrothermale DSM 13146 TaxID=1121390 RepID=A0A1W1X6N6_9BACT|nr:hypothetical protein [Desulfacinum hydrothermale]SMC19141.1 hypothetical protein SAMN02746041_00619 [Desulfacinum hydrothermale DSM 13146]